MKRNKTFDLEIGISDLVTKYVSSDTPFPKRRKVRGIM